MASNPPSPAPAATPAAPPATGASRSRLRRLLFWAVVVLLVAPALLTGLYVWVALRFSYSDGERAGYVQKFSRKGWVCKTWEGELAMVALPGTLPEIFRFTVRDDTVAEHINRSLGNRVSLHYEQHLGLPTSCFGETSYFVTSLRKVEP